MFRNYFKIAFRNLWKYKSFSLINIIGLATGLSCFLLISMYVMDELSYDRFNEKADRIYRINSDIRFGGTELTITQTSDMMGYMLKKDYPEVEDYTRIYTNNGNKLIKKGNEYINEQNVAHVDSTFFRIFTIPSVYGDTRNALNEPNTVVLTESAAKKYFGRTDVVGQTIETNDNNSTLYKITAVTKDLPANSHFQFDFFFSMKNVNYQWGQYLSHNFHTYLLLKHASDAAGLQNKFSQYIDRYVVPQAKLFMNVNSMDEFRKSGNKLDYSLMNIKKIHLYSQQSYEIMPSGNIQYIYIFSAVAIFILLIACINFMNLTTARSVNRAREVGIRKVLGTERKNLITQFLTESVLMTILAMIIALGITYFVLPVFNDVANKKTGFSSLFSPYFFPLLLALPFVVGLISGSYPAFFLSGFKPIEVLKGKMKLGSRSGLRAVLVVLQFATSVFLIIGTLVIYRQLNYIQTKNLGYNKDQVLIVNDAYALKNNSDAFKQEVLQMPGVLMGTYSSYLPVSNSSRNDNSYSSQATMDVNNGFNMQSWTVDYDYLPVMGMQLIKGRNFSRSFGTDSLGMIINEATARRLGYKDPVGKNIYRSTGDGKGNRVYTILGVVKDFNYESLRKPVGPLGFLLGQNTGLISFKVKAGNTLSLVKNIESKWKGMAPGMPFSYRFLDESFNEMYRTEQRVGKIGLSFSVLAIIIACLGLFGLAAFIAEQRTKEIGIRKVLGASVSGIVKLLSKEFVQLVMIAFIIAAPLAWWAMHTWLQDFAYRIPISWWIFPLAGITALFIALFTISFQAVRAAISNPVKNLRSE